MSILFHLPSGYLLYISSYIWVLWEILLLIIWYIFMRFDIVFKEQTKWRVITRDSSIVVEGRIRVFLSAKFKAQWELEIVASCVHPLFKCSLIFVMSNVDYLGGHLVPNRCRSQSSYVPSPSRHHMFAFTLCLTHLCRNLWDLE